MSTTATPKTGLGSTIRNARLDAGFTQEQVVGELRRRGAAVTQQTYSRYEGERVMPTSKMLGVLAEIFDVDAPTALEWLRAASRTDMAR